MATEGSNKERRSKWGKKIKCYKRNMWVESDEKKQMRENIPRARGDNPAHLNNNGKKCK